jgi:hypothetical protein
MPVRYDYTYQIVLSGQPHPKATDVYHAETRKEIEVHLHCAIEHALMTGTGGYGTPAMPRGGEALVWLRTLHDVSRLAPERVMTIGPRGGGHQLKTYPPRSELI